MSEIEERKKRRNKESTQDFRMRYRIHIDDIKYIKSRQWAVTYYLLLLFAGIIYFCKAMEIGHHGNFSFGRNLLFLLAFLIAALGTFFHCKFQSKLSKYRKRLMEISVDKNKRKLSDEFAEMEEKNNGDIDIDKYTSWWNGFFSFTLPFIVILWIGVIFVFLYLFNLNCIDINSALNKISNSLGYACIIIGSIGMIGYVTKFPFSTRIRDLKLCTKKWLGLNGYMVWIWSWILILLGSMIQILMIWISKK